MSAFLVFGWRKGQKRGRKRVERFNIKNLEKGQETRESRDGNKGSFSDFIKYFVMVVLTPGQKSFQIKYHLIIAMEVKNSANEIASGELKHLLNSLASFCAKHQTTCLNVNKRFFFQDNVL